MGTDLYSMLGVARTATTDEIVTAFREQAKELHPDRHPGDVEIAERFKQLTHAYNVLTRPERRDAYDRRSSPAPVAPVPEHASVFRTVGRARAAVVAGIGLIVVGAAGSLVLAGVDTGDAAKTATCPNSRKKPWMPRGTISERRSGSGTSWRYRG